MQTPDDETELQRAVREADEAEARLRRMKESLMPRDRADALRQLMEAELAAMVSRELRKFEMDIVNAKSEAEAQALTVRMNAAIVAGTERVKVAITEQMKAWTLAGLEDREAGEDFS